MSFAAGLRQTIVTLYGVQAIACSPTRYTIVCENRHQSNYCSQFINFENSCTLFHNHSGFAEISWQLDTDSVRSGLVDYGFGGFNSDSGNIGRAFAG